MLDVFTTGCHDMWNRWPDCVINVFRCNWRLWAPWQWPYWSGPCSGRTTCSLWCCGPQPVMILTGRRMSRHPSTTAPSLPVWPTVEKVLTPITHDMFYHILVPPLQGSPGELAAPRIRQKVPGTLMAKERASGTCLHTKGGKYTQMTRETPRVTATTNSRWHTEDT